MKKLILVLFIPLIVQGQINNTWLIGYGNWAVRARIIFETNNYILTQESRQMGFQGAEATISDDNGNFLMSSNGVWIADATGDTMINGGGLNPSWDVNAHPNGILTENSNMFLPFPNDSNKYILIHHALFSDISTYSYWGGVHKSVIDITANGGLGAVIEKNDTLIYDEISGGITACRHANGRDWWVIVQKDSSDVVYKILLTPNGVDTITTQHLGYAQFFNGNVSQITFSQDGKKFIQNNYHYVAGNMHPSFVILADFDRCTGMFSNTQTIQLTQDSYLWGLAFSPSGKYAYACSSLYLFQIDTDSLTVDTVATYDGFYSPYSWCCATTFWTMYLAANGKIYMTSGNGVQHIHEMNYPDSASIACDLQQHAINLGVWSFRAVPNHPNYYLGCDTTQTTCPCLITGINEIKENDFKFSISPNPSNGNFKIMYLLPQNSKGTFEVFDITGKKVFNYNLPQWSTLQNFDLSFLGNGIYHCSITSNNQRVNKKLVILNE
ncbi:MAG TPA: T9SS type A sorting domain-containing protein [Bacteroidia bacterium]|nr:T9SS type A sorting domain-containing protein [Bacteroidia bacterium]HNB13683.1 T9SS type A sorting domain-containing protein [Bacteroidia bacterium]HNL05690.1 T9SS type A sorting domain-containing protein [Bacteroidia bacterium]